MRRNASSAAIMLPLACAVSRARTASRLSSSDTSRCAARWSFAGEASATEVADAVALVASLLFLSAQTVSPAKRATSDEQDGADADEPSSDRPLTLRLGLLLAQLLVRLPPLEDRLGEDVVEELVADRGLAGGRGDGAEDAAALAAAELLEHGRDLRLGPSRPLGEVGGGVGDLRLRAGDEVAEEVGGRGLLAGGELAERLEQVVLDDLLRAAERLQPGQVERVRAGLDRRAPEPLQHELEEGRLDPAGRCRIGAGAVAALGEREPARGGRLDHLLGQRRLDLVGLLAGR